jgi:hypothetical protein
MNVDQCENCGKLGTGMLSELGLCPECSADDSVVARIEQDRRAWAEDEKDMQRIANEWARYDRDPPGS